MEDTTLRKMFAVTAGTNRRFPDGNEPFQVMTRLLEESGELAQMVNHFEGTGIKREKYGEPDPEKLAKEVHDVIRCALQVALYYHVEQALQDRFELSYQRLKDEGFITEP